MSIVGGPRPLDGFKRAFARKRVNELIDTLRFRFDSFPRTKTMLGEPSYVSYQPLPWVGRAGGRRAAGSYSRWNAIEPVLKETGAVTALDLGANAGFFTFKMAERKMMCVAVEDDPVFVRTALYVRREVDARHVGILSLRLDPDSVNLLPSVDATVFFSLWHHFVRAYGFDQATTMLSVIWTRTNMALFFDTGEEEMPESFGLPKMSPTPREWLGAYLTQNCAGGDVRHLGMHSGFYEADRNLFAVVRSR